MCSCEMERSNGLPSREVEHFCLSRTSIITVHDANEARGNGTRTHTSTMVDASWQSMQQSVRINFCKTSRGMSDR